MFGDTTSALTEKDVLAALKGVQDPDLRRDLVDLGMIKDVKIGPLTISLTVNLTTPACPLKAKIEGDICAALTERLGSDWKVQVQMTAEVRGKGIREKGDIPGVKNVLAVGSGKGGVGKLTLAAALAFGLQHYGAKVGLMDADVYGPSIPHLVGATGRPFARRTDFADRNRRSQAHVHRFFTRTRRRRDHARTDAPRHHSTVSSSGRMGRTRLPRHRPAPRNRRHSAHLAQSLPLTGAVVVCTPQEVALLDAVARCRCFAS